MRSSIKLAAFASVSLFSLATPAMAQGAAAANENSNEIIVTAQRRSEKLEEVPMSVTVVTAETLANAGVTSLRDLASVTSGYQLGGGGAFPQPAVRGVTTVINGTFENNVAVYIDGIYQPVAQAINIDLPNIQSVQVLKGPQGTLYGRNATGGAILLTTTMPTNEWHGKAEFTYARFNDKRGSAYIAGPLSDKIGFSLAGYIRRDDGYMRLASRTTPGVTTGGAIPINQDAIRAKLKFDLSESFSATLAYNYVHIDDSRTNAYSPIENVNPQGSTVYSRPGGATLPTTLGVEAYDIGDIMESKQHEGGLTLELDTGSGTLKSITAYAEVKTVNQFDFDGSYIPASYSSNFTTEKTFQETLDFTTSAIDKIDLTVGATYFHDKLVVSPGLNYGGNNPLNPGTTAGSLSDYTILSTSTFDQKKDAWAVYGDLTFHATDKLSLNVGGRYSEEKQDVFSQTVGNPVLLTPASCALFNCALAGAATFGALNRAATTASTTFKKFTPRASIRYELAPRTDIYFTYSQGFRSGAYNSALPACVNTPPVASDCYVPAKQETIDSFEAGFKTAGRNFRFEVAGFYYDYKNLQVSATRATAAGTPIVDITNSPKAKIYGADTSFEYNPTPNFTIRGSATWLHARYGDGFLFGGTGVAIVPSAANPSGLGQNINSDPLKTYLNVSQTQDLSGLQMSRAPDFSANLGFDYNIPHGDGGLRFSANVKYTSSYVLTNPSVWGTVLTAAQLSALKIAQNNTNGLPTDKLGVQRFREGAYALLSASVTWTDPSNHYYVRVWGTNLGDHKYRLHYSGTASGTYSPQAEPLVVGGTLGYKF